MSEENERGVAGVMRRRRLNSSRPDIFSPEIEHLAGEGLESGSLTRAQIETICGSVLNHVKQYREKIGIFKGFAPD